MNEALTDRDEDELEAQPRLGIWDILVAEDDTEIDLEELAAFAEGRLAHAQHEEMRCLVARSPRAMELVDSLQEFLEAESAGATQMPSPVSRAKTTATPSAEHWRTLALAVSVLVAAVAGSTAVYYHREARSSRWQVARNALTREIGRFNSELVEREGSRGARQPEQSIAGLLARSTKLGTPPVKVGATALLPTADSPAEAIDAIEQKISHDPTPELLNLQAAAWFQHASELAGPERDQAFVQAEKLLKSAEAAANTDSERAATHFIQVLFYRACGNSDREAKAWQKYLQHEMRPEYRDAAQLLLDPSK